MTTEKQGSSITLPRHVSLAELTGTLTKWTDPKRRIRYLNLHKRFVDTLANDRLYVSKRDMQEERTELLDVAERIKYVTGHIDELKTQLSSATYPEIGDLEDQIGDLEDQIDELGFELDEHISTLAVLWVKNKKHVKKLRNTRTKLALVTTQKNNYAVETLLLEEKIRTEPTVSLPKNFSKFDFKKQKELLRQLRTSSANRQQEINQVLSERRAVIEDFKKQQRDLNSLYFALRRAQEKIIEQQWTTINKRADVDSEISQKEREVASLTKKIRFIQNQQFIEPTRDLRELQLIEYILQKTFNRKVLSALLRVRFNFYIIIQEKDTEVQTIVNGKVKTKRQKYPKGKFQVLIDADSFVEPDTQTVLSGEDPLFTLLPHLKLAASEAIKTHLHVYFDPDSFVEGVTNIFTDNKNLGTSPVIVQVARSTNDSKGLGIVADSRFSNLENNNWHRELNSSIMNQREYNFLTSDMKEYVAELKHLGKYRMGLNEY